MDTQQLMQESQAHICQTYNRFNLALLSGSGCNLWDQEGRQYLDFVAGIAVCNLGHCPPELARILYEQAQQLVHVSNLYYTEPQAKLAADLTSVCFADKVFFGNSGAEAKNNVLSISGERKFEDEEKSEHYTRVERAYGSFSRTFTLPSTVDPSRTEARLEQGLLSVTLPKREEAKPHQISVKVG